MRRYLLLAGMVASTLPTCGHAEVKRTTGAAAARRMPGNIPWSVSDRAVVDRAKDKTRSYGDAEAGIHASYLALGSRSADMVPFGEPRMKLHVRQATASAWHDLGSGLVVKLRGFAGITTRVDHESPIFVRHTKTTTAGFEAALANAGEWQLSGELYSAGGWGGHSMQDDAMRIANGEPAAAHGVSVALTLPIGPSPSGNSNAASVRLEASSGKGGAVPGAPAQRIRQVALKLAAAF